MDYTFEKKEFFLLSIGSNLGDRIQNIDRAIKMLSNTYRIEIVRVSSFYETEPFGFTDQPWFVNVAVSGYSTLSAFEFFDYCKLIERTIGRQPRPKWREREIDIDIIFYGKQNIDAFHLQVPHKSMAERRFVLIPAVEIHPEYLHPKLNKTLIQLLNECKDKSKVLLFSGN